MEFWADVVLTDKLEEWLLLQGATVQPSAELPVWRNGKLIPGNPLVFFGGRQIYFYSDSHRKVRIFFNASNESARTLMLLLFADAIQDHNFKDMQKII